MVAAKVGSTDDYVNRYAYDTLGRVTRMTQAGVSGGNDVAEKRVDLAYSDDGTRWTLTRLADLAGTIPYEILCGIGTRVKRRYVQRGPGRP